MVDTNKIFIGVPFLCALLVEIIYPFLHTIDRNVWYSPPLRFNIILFLASMILLGFTMYEARRINDNYLFAYATVLIPLHIGVSICIFKWNKIAITLLLLALLFASFCHNEIFLSELVEDGDATFLNLFSAYILYLGFMLSITYETEHRSVKNGQSSDKKILSLFN